LEVQQAHLLKLTERFNSMLEWW